MKILLAIKIDHPEIANDKAIRWAPRTGFELRIFGENDMYSKLVNLVNDVNYNWYVHIKHDQIVTKQDVKAYAYEQSIDLLVTIPQSLKAWRKGTMLHDKETFYCREALGKARLEFGNKPRMRIKRFANGVTMERLFYEQ